MGRGQSADGTAVAPFCHDDGVPRSSPLGVAQSALSGHGISARRGTCRGYRRSKIQAFSRRSPHDLPSPLCRAEQPPGISQTGSAASGNAARRRAVGIFPLPFAAHPPERCRRGGRTLLGHRNGAGKKAAGVDQRRQRKGVRTDLDPLRRGGAQRQLSGDAQPGHPRHRDPAGGKSSAFPTCRRFRLFGIDAAAGVPELLQYDGRRVQTASEDASARGSFCGTPS